MYYVALPFIYLISFLPFPVLYAVSDFAYVLLYHVVGYRKKVVLENLRNACPEKTEQELKQISKQFYHHLCDLFLETLKILTISKKSILEHCYFHPDAQKLYDTLAAENKSVIMVMGHMGNWEWAGHPFALLCRQQLDVIYHPLSNKNFDTLMLKMRTRFGTRAITMRSAYKTMVTHKDELTATVFIADQTPPPETAYWTTFLHQDTPIFKGTETIAKKLNYPVVYASMRKVKRGYYEMYSEMLCENPAATKEGEITELHTRRLEKDIYRQPEIWLWSHLRWKHKKPV